MKRLDLLDLVTPCSGGRPPVVTLLQSNPYRPLCRCLHGIKKKKEEGEGVKSFNLKRFFFFFPGGYLAAAAAASSSQANISF